MMSYARRMEPDLRQRRTLRPATMLRRIGVRLVLALLRWQELAQQRRRLLSLDERMLKDIGITRSQAMREGTRPFWDVPGIDGARWP